VGLEGTNALNDAGAFPAASSVRAKHDALQREGGGSEGADELYGQS
jgi:hypothetical protein